MHTPDQTLPGRLRLRFTQLKEQTGQLDSMAAAMYAIDGVMGVETSARTGGLLIHYHTASGKAPLFWDRIEAVLLAHDLFINPRPLARQTGWPDAGPGPVRPAAPAGAAR